jgi:hypothetical protein
MTRVIRPPVRERKRHSLHGVAFLIEVAASHSRDSAHQAAFLQ